MRIPSWFLLIFAGFAVVFTAATGLFAYSNVRQFVATAPIALPTLGSLSDVGAPPTAIALVAPTDAPVPVNPTATLLATNAAPAIAATTSAATQSAVPAAASIPALSDPSRVTILLLGIDQRKGEKGPFRTDTMIVLSIDPIRKTGVILSVPRDIYTQIPGHGADRINNAEALGEMADYPGGAPRLSVRTVEALLGIPIQHYFLINFDVFNAIVDSIGPVNVCPSTAIHDSNYPDGSYGIITVDFPAGCQDLDATKLLEYSRVRHNAGDDFGRAARQQEVIRAVRDKVLSLGGMSALIVKAGTLWDTIKTSVKTDMTFDQMLQLAQMAQGISKNSISSVVLTDKGGYLLPSTTASGEQVMTPIYEHIHTLISQMFDAPPGQAITDQGQPPANSASTAATPITNTGSAAVSVATASTDSSSAAIQVSNGAGINGLGKQIADKLRVKGFTVLDPKNADSPGAYTQTVIHVYTDKIDVARAVATALGLNGSVITHATNGPKGVDIEVIVGKDLVTATKAP